MELFQELLITVGVSLLVSFVITKLFSMAPPCDALKGYSASVSVTSAIEEAAFSEKKSVAWDAGTNRRRGEIVVKESSAECDEILRSQFVSEEIVVIGGDEFEHRLFDESPKRGEVREIEVESGEIVGMRPEREKFREIEIKSGRSEEIRVLDTEANKGKDSNDDSDGAGERNRGEGEEEEEGLFDDWEGIERTELEKDFGSAVVFVGSKSNADRVSSLDNDTKMKLFGLQKVALEGPCRVPSPMALKASARAKW